MGDEWAKWLRDNFDKLLLWITYLLTCGLVVHLAHHEADVDQVLWAREMVGTILGALLGLITGHALASRTTATTTVTPPGGPGAPGASITASTEGK
jgi:hypothetical protein